MICFGILKDEFDKEGVEKMMKKDRSIFEKAFDSYAT
jgi:hypothetical protein